MRVLISGGAGFIGSNLAIKLLSKGYGVVILDNLSEQIHGKKSEESYSYNLVKDKCDFIFGDVRNYTSWDIALKNIDIVVHLAAETGTGQSMYEINKYIDVNIGGTAKLLELISKKKNQIKKIVVASSRSIYGEGKYKCDVHGVVYPISRKDEDMSEGDFEVKCPLCGNNVEMLPTDEESKLNPSSVYGHTKQSQEELSMIVGKSIKIPVVALRFQNVYGPGQSLKNPYTGILSIFSTRIKNGNDIAVFEDGLETRDFVYIDDVTDAIVLSIENDGANFNSFNVGSGENIDILTVAKVLKENFNSGAEIRISGNYRLGDIRHNLGDLNKINCLLGYKPKVMFKEGISNFIAWAQKQNKEDDGYDKSITEMKNRGLYK